MAGPAPFRVRRGGHGFKVRADADPPWVRRTLIGIALLFLFVALVVPVLVVFEAAFRDGAAAYWKAITEPDTTSAIELTLLTAAIAVPVNIVFGIAAAWAITRFHFRGKRFLVSLIDLPFAVSPVIAGMIFVLLFGAQSWLGPYLSDQGIKIVFAAPAVVLATTFVTVPFVARELIPALEARGPEQELAALTLGATGWQAFWRVTLPNLRWALFYGGVLCAARAVGEFGAVSVVSGHIRGETNTVPLHVEILYNEYQYSAAFAVATLLIGVAVVTLALKAFIEWRVARALDGKEG
jgi:sulfate/thiosulfate transport system permease protein